MAEEPPSPSPQNLDHQRARSVPHRGPFVSALIFSGFFYLSLAGTCAALFAVFEYRSQTAAIIFVALVGINVLMWLIAYMKRRGASCPLCKCMPYIDTHAHKHIHATRIFPFTYGTSNLLTSLVRQRFRCPYCGTPFDLLKNPDRSLRSRR